MVKFLDKNSGFNQFFANKNTSTKSSKTGSFLWWLVIFLLTWWLFSTWFMPKENTTAVAEPIVVESIENVSVYTHNDDKLSIAVQGLRISSLEMKDYMQDKKQGGNVTLLNNDGDFIEIGLIANGTIAPTSTTQWKHESAKGPMVFSFKNQDGVGFQRSIIVNDYLITVRDEIKNNSGKDISFAPYASLKCSGGGEKSIAVNTGVVAFVNSDTEYNDWGDLEKKSYAYQTTNGFVGFVDQYWETIASVGAPDQTIRVKKAGQYYQVDTHAVPVQISAGNTTAIETQIFAGPRDPKILADVSSAITGIDQTMDYGWFWFLSRPMLWALHSLNDIVMNYGVAIILLTIFIRILMWPLTRKSFVSMAAMQKMQPEMTRIQKLYANDKARQQMELMKLYQTHKTSPMSGCLPMLLQIPIFFALYKALLISVPMRQANFLWISDLSVMDPWFILPIIMGATMWWQQSLQTAKPAADDKNNPMAQTQKIMKWMPILFTAMFAFMPAGLVLYWTISNVFGIGQMYVIKKTAK